MVKAVSDPGRRRQLLSGVTALVLAGLPLGARAQGVGALPRIGLITGAANLPIETAFLQGMRELGTSTASRSSSSAGLTRNTRSFPPLRRSWFSSSRG